MRVVEYRSGMSRMFQGKPTPKREGLLWWDGHGADRGGYAPSMLRVKYHEPDDLCTIVHEDGNEKVLPGWLHPNELFGVFKRNPELPKCQFPAKPITRGKATDAQVVAAVRKAYEDVYLSALRSSALDDVTKQALKEDVYTRAQDRKMGNWGSEYTPAVIGHEGGLMSVSQYPFWEAVTDRIREYLPGDDLYIESVNMAVSLVVRDL